MSKNHLGEEERKKKKETTAGGMCVRVRVSNSGICFSKTRVDTVVGTVLLAGAGPSSSLRRKATATATGAQPAVFTLGRLLTNTRLLIWLLSLH